MRVRHPLARTAPARPAVLARAAVVGVAVSTLFATAAAPAYAQSAEQDVVGAGAATAVVLTLNLPGGAATKITLTLNPVSGTVTKSRQSTTANADATVLRGTLGEMPMDVGGSSAMLPEPKQSEMNPAGALTEGLAGTPLENLLTVEAGPSQAEVTEAPTSTSSAAVANLGAGLPDELAGALAPLTEPLAGAVNDVLTALADGAGVPVAQVCDGLGQVVGGLDPVTGPLQGVLDGLPIPIPVEELLNQTTVDAVCGLAETLRQLNAALQDALASLTGDSGLFGISGISAEQAITRDGQTVGSQATATVAGITLLGQAPFASVDALTTTSSASTKGTPNSATATVNTTVAELTGGSVDPFLQLRATLDGIQDSFVGAGALPAALGTVFTDLFATLDAALGPIGVSVFDLDDVPAAQALEACPGSLDGTLAGTFTAADGRCAAAATRGAGLSVTLPEALATPLMIAGPLVELQIVPTSAAVRAQPASALAPDAIEAPPARPAALPRTGLDSALPALAGIGLLGAAAVLRRRRSSITAVR